MTLNEWIATFAATSLFWKWILSWGGAEWLEGWKSFFIIDWFAARWTADQIKVYALLSWIGSGIWFAFGLMKPGFRFTW